MADQRSQRKESPFSHFFIRGGVCGAYIRTENGDALCDSQRKIFDECKGNVTRLLAKKDYNGDWVAATLDELYRFNRRLP